jgi:Spy/CpxP family protein refolding chaperone
MRRGWGAVVLGAVVIAAPALGTTQESGHRHTSPASASRAGVLSDSQVQQLLEGAGMGQAMAAEMTGHPGPKHVLEQAAALGLTPDQAARTKALFEAMQADARRLGGAVIDAERALYEAFAAGSPSRDAIESLSLRVGRAQAALRARHLRAHVEMMPILTPEQVAAYRRK